MGNLFSQPSPPPPTPPAPPATMRDEIGGTEQVPVKNADGSITYITRRLPLSPQEQAEKEAYERLMKESLAEIERLSRADYQTSESAQEVLDVWRKEQLKQLDDAFEGRSQEEEKSLARRGLSDSSAGQALRRQRYLDEQEAEGEIDRGELLLKNDIRQEQLAAQQNLYNIAANQQGVDAAKAYQSSAKGLENISALNATNRASLSDYYNRQVSSFNAAQSTGYQPSVFSNASTLATTIASPVGSAVGGVLGRAIGRIF